jgi:hypothetical protein
VALRTHEVWLQYELFRGTLSQDAFDASERKLADFMGERANSRILPSCPQQPYTR